MLVGRKAKEMFTHGYGPGYVKETKGSEQNVCLFLLHSYYCLSLGFLNYKFEKKRREKYNKSDCGYLNHLLLKRIMNVQCFHTILVNMLFIS